MSCYHPIVAYDYNPKYRKLGDKRVIRFTPPSLFESNPDVHQILLPCGKCVGCRLDYSRAWANRCLMELQYHDSAYFVTLTYDDVHVPTSWSVDKDTGEALSPSMTLSRRDTQLFFKLLRRRFADDRIRYFGCGEYGTQTLRPHYHLILFGLHLDDLELYSKSRKNPADSYWLSPSLDNCWYDCDTDSPRGRVIVARVTWQSCAYVARYMLKKAKGLDDVARYAELGIVPEFAMMSRRPGIGYQYYVDHPEIWRYDKVTISTETGGRQFPPPPYFRRMYQVDNPLEASILSDQRQLTARLLSELKMSLTDKDFYDILISSEESKQKQIRALTRNII